MGWSIGYDENWKRDIGYDVPAICDHPKCNEKIHRGLAYVCGGEHYGGEHGCGLFFCYKHLTIDSRGQLCPKCYRYDHKPYKPKEDVIEWIKWKLTDESWEEWRRDNPKKVNEYKLKS